jgi:hypothetical protein
MSLITKKYKGQQFGKYTFQVCSKTKFLEAKGMLEIYNVTAVEKQKLKVMNQYMRGKAFKKAVCSDFDKTSKDSKLDLDYLKQLCEEESGSKKLTRFPQSDSDSKATAAWALKLPVDLKFAYMVRETSIVYNGNIKKIAAIDIHPLVGIGLAMWLSDEFASEVKDAFLRLVSGDLSIIKNVVLAHDSKNGTATEIAGAVNPETKEFVMVAYSRSTNANNWEDSFAAKSAFSRIKALEDELNGKNTLIAFKDNQMIQLMGKMDQILGYAKDTNHKLDEAGKQLDEASTKANIMNHKLDEASTKANIMNHKLDKAIQNSILMQGLPTCKEEMLYVYQPTNSRYNKEILQIFCCQKGNIGNLVDDRENRMAKKRAKATKSKRIRNIHYPNLQRISEIGDRGYTPNSVIFLNRFLSEQLSAETIERFDSRSVKLAIETKEFLDIMKFDEAHRDNKVW